MCVRSGAVFYVRSLPLPFPHCLALEKMVLEVGSGALLMELKAFMSPFARWKAESAEGEMGGGVLDGALSISLERCRRGPTKATRSPRHSPAQESCSDPFARPLHPLATDGDGWPLARRQASCVSGSGAACSLLTPHPPPGLEEGKEESRIWKPRRLPDPSKAQGRSARAFQDSGAAGYLPPHPPYLEPRHGLPHRWTDRWKRIGK